jgi:hypothetical protein
MFLDLSGLSIWSFASFELLGTLRELSDVGHPNSPFASKPLFTYVIAT